MEIDFLFQSFSISALLIVLVKLSGLVEEALPKATEDYIAGIMYNASRQKLYDWFRRYIVALIEKGIGKNVMSLKAFFRICRNSFLCSFTLYILALFFNSTPWESLTIQDWIRGIIIFFLEFLVFNVTIDYLTFQKSICILRALSRQQQIRKSWWLLLADVLITFCLGFLKFTVLLVFHYKQGNYHLSNLLSYFYNYVLPLKYLPEQKAAANHLSSIPGAFFYSTFFSSLFIWIMIITCNLLNLKLLQSPIFQKMVDIKTKPIKAIKLMFMVIVTCSWVLFNIMAYVVVPLFGQLYYYFLPLVNKVFFTFLTK